MAISPSLIFFILITTAAATIATATTTCTAVDASISQCDYIKSNADCNSNGYIKYAQIFYCNFSQFPKLGFLLLLLWLVILLYTLTNTSSEYFCPAVQHFSKSLHLSPAIAGTTLLAFGSGSLDVLSSVIAFTTAGGAGGEIGLNSVLGGGIFLSTVVVGVLSLVVTYRRKTVVIDKRTFIRDIVFLLITLINLIIIIVIGRINLLSSVLFVSIYIVYIILVAYMHFTSMNDDEDKHGETLKSPLLDFIDEEKQERYIKFLFYVIKLPIDLPRRLTIPMVTQERFSKPILVTSMVLAPIMVGLIWNTKDGNLGFKTSLVTYLVVGSIGIALGGCTFAFTSSTTPPQKCLVFWHGSGFLMSVTWTYITCNELVSLLESLGNIIGISPSIIGLTILAWGNSFGDLTGNLALAIYGGSGGSQIAMAECYAEPLFCVLIGIGFSFVFLSWWNYPASYVIPSDPNLLETIGFFMIALLWALAILLKRNMRLDQTLGGGLLIIYFCFLFIKIARALELIGVSSYGSVHSL